MRSDTEKLPVCNKDSLEAFSKKYSGRLPRYTSYPTALELKNCTDTDPVEKVLVTASSRPLSLYIHLPYCPSLCYFCACNKIISTDEQKRREYLDYLALEVDRLVETAGKLSLSQIHLGGGSPSFLNEEELEILDRLVSSGFRLTDNCNRSIEVDPRTFSAEKAKKLVSSGYNRFSLGVQDFDPAVQKIINRIQPYELTRDTIVDLRELGITSINLDLIYGLPGQNIDSFSTTLDQVCELRPERIALFGYAHVNWKVKVQHVFEKHGLLDSETRLKLFTLATEKLLVEGYEYIGLDHFALPEDELNIARKEGTLRRNFMGYTTDDGAGVLGIGISSISDIEGILYQNDTSLSAYHENLKARKLPVAKILERSVDDRIRAYIIERLMCDCKLNLPELMKKFPEAETLPQIFAEGISRLEEYEKDGLVSCSSESIKVTFTGRFFLRHIAAAFDAYLKKHENNNKTFSQAV